MYSNKINSITMSSHNLTKIARKSGFKLRDMENREVDWRAVGSIDINKLVDMQDFDMLVKVIPKIIEAPMNTVLSTSVLDPSISAMFRLSQLGLQYLSFCLQFMDHTLFELKSTMHQLQKHNSTLRQNYKNLEEEHYKVKEQLERQSSHATSQKAATDHTVHTHDVSSQYSFACKLCTKNFRSNESLDAHMKRKHDNDGQCASPMPPGLDHQSNIGYAADAEAKRNDKDIKDQSNLAVVNGIAGDCVVNEGKSVVCADCEERKQLTAVEISVQCNLEVAVADKPLIEHATDKEEDTSPEPINSAAKLHRNENYENLISAMRHEMLSVINQFQLSHDQRPKSSSNGQTERVLEQTNDKIDSIQERFTQFQEIFFKHQSEFAESFRNLDDRQQYYINHVNDMLKSVKVEAAKENSEPTVAVGSERKGYAGASSDNESQVSDDDVVCKPQVQSGEKSKVNGSEIVDSKLTYTEYSSTEGSSSSDQDDDYEHRPSDQASDSMDPIEPTKEMTREAIAKILDEKLAEIGIKSSMNGISSSIFDSITHKLVAERERNEVENQSFATTRKQLKNEMQSMAKKRNIETPLNKIHNEWKIGNEQSKDRNILNQLIVNNIDESDIEDKISRAHSVLEAHRESIKTLLGTTVQSPNTMVARRLLQQPSSTSAGIADPYDSHVRSSGRTANNTRRVVFVNLDEDS